MVKKRLWVLSRAELLSKLPTGETALLLGDANGAEPPEGVELFTDASESSPHPKAKALEAKEIIELLFSAEKIING